MILKAENASRQFLRKRNDSNVFYAVNNITLTLQSGTFVALFGRSGSGKSTLLNLLSGLLAPTAGRIMLDEVDLYQMEDVALSRFRNEHFGVIPQGQAALQSLTAMENVLLPCTLYGDVSPAIIQRAENLLEITGIGQLKDVRPSELSGGELRRMSIARALIRDPDVILADEPTADLDDENTEKVLNLLKTVSQQGKIVFVATHDKDTFAYADSVYRMDAGQIKKEGIV